MLIIILFGTACTTLETYTSATLGISVKYPSDWQVHEGDSDNVTFSPTSASTSLTISLDDVTINPDPISTLEKISATSLSTGALEFAEPPELVQIRDYQAARMQAAAALSVRINEKGILEFSNELSTTSQENYTVPLEIIAIVDGNNAVIVIIQGPNREAYRIVESLSFTN
jgi:hypothetical protein